MGIWGGPLTGEVVEAVGAVGVLTEGRAEDETFAVIDLSFSMLVPLTESSLLLLLGVGWEGAARGGGGAGGGTLGVETSEASGFRGLLPTLFSPGGCGAGERGGGTADDGSRRGPVGGGPFRGAIGTRGVVCLGELVEGMFFPPT